MKTFGTVLTLCVMCVCVNGFLFGRQHPLFGNDPDMLTAALLFGLDGNELMALQSLSQPDARARSQFQRDISVLSMLGLIDGADAPDNKGPGAAGRGGGKNAAGAAAGGEGGPGGEGGEGGAAVKKAAPKERARGAARGGAAQPAPTTPAPPRRTRQPRH
ncbi:hypothetical protein DPMN_168728 [Dreissena polymorpha]|uniref:Uncharacterized protein n=1 Tax=Dreissena polymorpha TaxID=45954 RepID=A0A9D4F5N8_DREPO|nr:hypothetical protein DPMN_168728 [Dreissena polymorpha]